MILEEKGKMGESDPPTKHDICAIILCMFFTLIIGMPLIEYYAAPFVEFTKKCHPNSNESFVLSAISTFCILYFFCLFMMVGRMLSATMLYLLDRISAHFRNQSIPDAEQEHSEGNCHCHNKVRENKTKSEDAQCNKNKAN